MSADLPLLALIVGVVILAVCALAMSGTLPRVPAWWSRDRSTTRAPAKEQSVVVTYERPSRRAVTGPPPALPITQVPILPNRMVRQVARQMPPAPDTPSQASATAAERTIESLLETDPAVLAGIIMHWLREDPPATPTTGRAAISEADR